MKKKKVMFVLPCMKGGGAERVAALLANEFHKAGIETSFLLASSEPKDVIRIDLDETIPLTLLSEMPTQENGIQKRMRKLVRFGSSIVCKTFEKWKKPVPAYWAYLSFWSEYRNEINKLRSILEKDPELCVISFLQPSIPMTVLAARGLTNRLIISERGNPMRLMKKRYGWNFIEKYYSRIDAAVFQTIDAKNCYPECVSRKGTVIFNPIKAGLPEPYYGERNKNITTFCRISPEKDLDVLIEAFSILQKEYPDYHLRIIGDAVLDNEQKLLCNLKWQVKDLGLSNFVEFKQFSPNVHHEIIHDAMYINSSETEGMSNAMLEAMAIGMPVVCTDCPIGGARTAIQNGINGLLVPIKNSEELYNAMKKVIDHPELALELSSNASNIYGELQLRSIAQQWMDLLYLDGKQSLD